MILNKANFFSGPRNKEPFNLGGTGYGIIDGPDGEKMGLILALDLTSSSTWVFGLTCTIGDHMHSGQFLCVKLSRKIKSSGQF